MAKSKKKKARRNVSRGIAHVQSTFNNTIVTITDTNGDTLCQSSGGTVGLGPEASQGPLCVSLRNGPSGPGPVAYPMAYPSDSHQPAL